MTQTLLFSKLGEGGEYDRLNTLHEDRETVVLQTAQPVVCVVTFNSCPKGIGGEEDTWKIGIKFLVIIGKIKNENILL